MRLAGGWCDGCVASGLVDGVGSAAKFSYPYGVSVDSVGNVYVADTNNNLIRTIRPTGAGIYLGFVQIALTIALVWELQFILLL